MVHHVLKNPLVADMIAASSRVYDKYFNCKPNKHNDYDGSKCVDPLGKIRVRGRGTGPTKIRGEWIPEADVRLRVEVSCDNEDAYNAAKEAMEQEMEKLRGRYERTGHHSARRAPATSPPSTSAPVTIRLAGRILE